MPCPVRIALAGVLLVAGGTSATLETRSVSFATVRADVPRLVQEIRRSSGAEQAELLLELTSLGSEESLTAMKQLCEAMEDERSLQRAFAAFVNYRAVELLEGPAVDYLASQCQAKSEPTRRAAAAGLVRFSPADTALLSRLVERSRDEVVRALLLGPLLPELQAAGTPDALRLIIGSARVGRTGDRATLLATLSSFLSTANEGIFLEALSDRKISTQMQVLIVETVSLRESPGVEKALRGALESYEADLVLAAMLALDLRAVISHAAALKKLIKFRDESVRRQAVISLGRVRGGEEGWPRQLARLARDKDPSVRMGSAVALADLRTPEALEVLHRLLVDSDHLVQRETLQQLANMRRKESLPVLVARLSEVRGLTRRQLLLTLRMITALDHGTSPERWSRWWTNEGRGFEVPSLEVAQRAELERLERRASSETISTFYGLHVVSDRACFIMDVSRSMLAPSGEGNRLDVAKRELGGVLEKYPTGDLFNVIFFSSDAFPWSRKLVEMSAKKRAEARAFVSSQEPRGTTAIYDALELAFKDRRIDTIYLLTDGDPAGGTVDDPGVIRAEVARWNKLRKIRIHGVAVGQSSLLLEELASDTGGEYREVK
jgi:HEAT repeat protein